MKKFGVWTMFLCASLIFAPLNAGATNINISGVGATEDANPDQGSNAGRGANPYPFMFPGSAESYSHGSHANYNTNEWTCITLTQWNLPDAQGQTIDSVISATANFMASASDYSGAYHFYRLTSAFEEDTVTWDTKPAIDISTCVVWDPETAPSNGSVVTIDLTNLLARNGNMSTFGIACIQVGGNAGGFLCQKESGAVPTLNATYSVVPEPITLGIMGLGGLMLVSRKK